MIDLNTDQADQVFRLLFGGCIALLITSRTLHLASLKLDGGTHWYKPDLMIRFINRDSVIFVMTLLMSLLAWLPAVWVSSPGYVLDFLSAARAELGLFGWAVTISVIFNFFAPFIVALMLFIGRTRRVRKYGSRQTIGPDWA